MAGVFFLSFSPTRGCGERVVSSPEFLFWHKGIIYFLDFWLGSSGLYPFFLHLQQGELPSFP